jgi:hypothetical protein
MINQRRGAMDRIDSMTVFAKVVASRSFSGAARELRLSQAVVSKHVHSLESWLGARLSSCSAPVRCASGTEIGQMRNGRLPVVAGLLVLASCASIGPNSVRRDRVDYIGAVADSWKYQTLLNIVRLRYGDAPVFVDVSSLISSYTFQSQLSLSGEFITDTTGSFYNPSASTTYTDKPTITYTPLTGDKFAKSLLRPIPPPSIFSLLQAGFPADFVLRTTVRAINGIYNRSDEGAKTRPADPEFYPLLEAIRRIERAGALGLRVEKREAEEITVMSFPGRQTAELTRDIEYVFKTLRLKPEKGEITISFGATQRAPNDIAVLSRSMISILAEIASRIEVPPQDIADGRTLELPAPEPAQSPLDRPIVSIHSTPERPPATYAAVSYHGTWYWVDDHDFNAKRAFTFLMLFFSLAETGVISAPPVVTIPAS